MTGTGSRPRTVLEVRVRQGSAARPGRVVPDPAGVARGGHRVRHRPVRGRAPVPVLRARQRLGRARVHDGPVGPAGRGAGRRRGDRGRARGPAGAPHRQRRLAGGRGAVPGGDHRAVHRPRADAHHAGRRPGAGHRGAARDHRVRRAARAVDRRGGRRSGRARRRAADPARPSSAPPHAGSCRDRGPGGRAPHPRARPAHRVHGRRRGRAGARAGVPARDRRVVRDRDQRGRAGPRVPDHPQAPRGARRAGGRRGAHRPRDAQRPRAGPALPVRRRGADP